VSVYKPCDIRGPISELSPDLYGRWGRILGAGLPAGSEFVAGGDVRETTGTYLAALVEGLAQAGMRVVNLGVRPTPVVYFEKRRREAAGCAIVTASHSPPDMNGLKWMAGDRPPTERDVATLEEAAARGAVEVRQRGDILPGDATAYEQWITERWRGSDVSPDFYVILDPGNGCWSTTCLRLVRRAFPETMLSIIHDIPSGEFPERNPDCARPEYLAELAEAVVEHGADLGVAFDGDGDRVAFVDCDGHVLSAEEATWVLMRTLDTGFQGRPFVYDIKFSDQMGAGAAQLGGVPMAERSGHAFIRTRMLDEGAAFGAEISGHYFYEELQGGDDGLFTACRMIAHVGTSGTTLADMRRSCPPIYMTPDLRVNVPADHPAFLEHVQKTFGDLPQTHVDGVRVEFPHGWALIRSSVTEHKLTVRFEGDSQDDLEGIVRDVCEGLPEIALEVCEEYLRAAPSTDLDA